MSQSWGRILVTSALMMIDSPTLLHSAATTERNWLLSSKKLAALLEYMANSSIFLSMQSSSRLHQNMAPMWYQVHLQKVRSDGFAREPADVMRRSGNLAFPPLRYESPSLWKTVPSKYTTRHWNLLRLQVQHYRGGNRDHSVAWIPLHKTLRACALPTLCHCDSTDLGQFESRLLLPRV